MTEQEYVVMLVSLVLVVYMMLQKEMPGKMIEYEQRVNHMSNLLDLLKSWLYTLEEENIPNLYTFCEMIEKDFQLRGISIFYSNEKMFLKKLPSILPEWAGELNNSSGLWKENRPNTDKVIYANLLDLETGGGLDPEIDARQLDVQKEVARFLMQRWVG